MTYNMKIIKIDIIFVRDLATYDISAFYCIFIVTLILFRYLCIPTKYITSNLISYTTAMRFHGT